MEIGPNGQPTNRIIILSGRNSEAIRALAATQRTEPAPSFAFENIDYSVIEERVMANLIGDDPLIPLDYAETKRRYREDLGPDPEEKEDFYPNNRRGRRAQNSKKGPTQFVGNSKSGRWNGKPRR